MVFRHLNGTYIILYIAQTSLRKYSVRKTTINKKGTPKKKGNKTIHGFELKFQHLSSNLALTYTVQSTFWLICVKNVFF